MLSSVDGPFIVAITGIIVVGIVSVVAIVYKMKVQAKAGRTGTTIRIDDVTANKNE